jgi:hypothetical protein
MDYEVKAAFRPALFRDYMQAVEDTAKASPAAGAEVLLQYVDNFCDHYGHDNKRHAFELAVLNIGHTQLGRLLPMFARLDSDECRAHPGLCEAITIARESLGIRSMAEQKAPQTAQNLILT